jgi:hypothetical protein
LKLIIVTHIGCFILGPAAQQVFDYAIHD